MSEQIVIIGAVALGPKVAARLKRIHPTANITLIDKDQHFSYGGCGIPYFISGDVSDADQLQMTSYHMIRDEEFFKNAKGVTVLASTEALEIDREKKSVLCKDLKTEKEFTLEYDKLVIATGAVPKKLNVEGASLKNIHTVSNLEEAKNIKSFITQGNAANAVIIGAGFIGLEMAEAFADMWGLNTTIIEKQNQALPNIVGASIAQMIRHHLEENDVRLLTDTNILGFKGEDGSVSHVLIDGEEIPADIVIVAVGVQPNDTLAKKAGLETHAKGGIVVNNELQSSDPLIYAGGDCICLPHLLTKEMVHLPLGSLSNRLGRLIANNIAGAHEKFEAVNGAFCVKIFERTVAAAGITLDVAKAAGYDAISVLQEGLDRAHFMATKEVAALELVVDRKTRKVLGLHGLSKNGDALVGRINVISALLNTNKNFTIDDLSIAEFAYSPPYSAAMDLLNSIANIADNILDERVNPIDPITFKELWEKEDDSFFFLDCRELANAEPYLKLYPERWHNIPQKQIPARINEIPKDKKLVLVCNSGTRSYEVGVALQAAGFKDIYNTAGGFIGIGACGLDFK